jgi:acyl carrier protein
MQTKNQLRNYIFSELARDNYSANLSDDDSLVENGVLDSVAIVQLLSFIENNFETIIDDEELIPENFETINLIYSLIKRKES